MRILSHPLSQSLVIHTLCILLLTSLWIPSLNLLSTPKENEAEKWLTVEILQNTVVQTATLNPTKEVAKESFLGEHNQTVQRQTVSKTSGVAQAKSASKSTVVPQKVSLADLGLSKSRPVFDDGSLTQTVGGEYLKGLEENEQTLLNTREYVFFSYFKRVRESLDYAWDKSLQAKLKRYFSRGRHLASEQDYQTRLLVTLNDQGNVIRIQTLDESGTEDLDSAAIEAFEAAGPFPNPPKGLLQADGTVKIRWDFILRT